MSERDLFLEGVSENATFWTVFFLSDLQLGHLFKVTAAIVHLLLLMDKNSGNSTTWEIPDRSNHQTSDDELRGVYNHLNKTQGSFRFHETILKFGEPGSLGSLGMLSH